MSRTKISGWGLLIILAALPAVLWMGSGSTPDDAKSGASVVRTADASTNDRPPAWAPVSDASPAAVASDDSFSADRGSADLALLGEWLSGNFSNAAQSSADPAYADTRLHVVPVWKERSDALWFYAERKAAARPGTSHRLRVYRLTQLGPGLFESQVYKLPGETRFAGAWKERIPLAGLTPDSLLACPGSSTVLRRTRDGAFMGSTLGGDCESNPRGASYATSELRIEADRILAWDRGFDASGRQLSGAGKGPYKLLRVPEETSRNLGAVPGERD